MLDAQLGRALNAIHLTPEAPWSVNQLADLASMSRSKFSARFTELVGVPPISYLAAWLVGESVVENQVVENLGRLFESAKKAAITVAVSPHYYYPSDHAWAFGGGVEKLMHDICMFERTSPVSLEGFENSGADFLPQFKPYIFDGKTIICSPHKVFGPETNDLTLQLRKKGISQIILAGMAANLCVESHLRELVEQGFEVAVVRDATAGPRTPEGDGYLAAIINYRYIANALWTTDHVVATLT